MNATDAETLHVSDGSSCTSANCSYSRSQALAHSNFSSRRKPQYYPLLCLIRTAFGTAFMDYHFTKILILNNTHEVR